MVLFKKGLHHQLASFPVLIQYSWYSSHFFVQTFHNFFLCHFFPLCSPSVRALFSSPSVTSLFAEKISIFALIYSCCIVSIFAEGSSFTFGISLAVSFFSPHHFAITFSFFILFQPPVFLFMSHHLGDCSLRSFPVLRSLVCLL